MTTRDNVESKRGALRLAVQFGALIVVLFAILDRLSDMYYAEEPEHIQMTKEELKAWLKEKE